MAIDAGSQDETDAGGRWRWAIRELPAAAVLGVLAVLALGPSALLVGALYIAAVTGELVRIDLASRCLPNRLVLPGYPVVLAGIAVHGIFTGTQTVPALLAGAAWFVVFLLLNLCGGMGMGDVKLAGVLGLCLGSIGAAQAVAGLTLGFLFGGVGGILVLMRRVGGTDTLIPFGPFLLAGFWVAVALTPATSTL
ncbi:A24 family peptidase [Mycetocola sp.]|jgi:leader peptidase (prepilin peptidase)/N-methyltransferase|uniref:prepilin peptidase n=1 Tax=Mycetocola sp. TaxID=1871042 RepID=UPI00260EB126|nr:A24 family peptidase [Mycetocola sp.]MCU1561067.1 prepilin peptidase [Mycetocola sp.]